ncbi:PAQR family membrane homeostasis protein TrhA [Bifidobacterium aerophilum]|uniref:Hemolysin III family protein n=1 Tax=Bifidobacterium aerophilum TaxID=1798155 RepID=A0A6N9Z5H6_9BIFI|nr:hemolysin III family protein [Bifidobacterium aerophilum]NEG89385.1 hemolysin III family protein [Bifidobacterium aerophilum]
MAVSEEDIARKRAAIAAARDAATKAREAALQAKADAVRVRAKAKAERIRRKGEEHALAVIAKAETKAARLEGISPAEVERKIRLDVHGRPKPLLRGWIHAVAAPLALAAGIVLICLAQGAGLKWACAVFMTCSLVLFANSAAYHLGDWSPRVTDVLRRIDHMNIFLLIAGTYTPVSFALEPRWRNAIIAGMWACTLVALVIHVIWIGAPRWLYVIVYIVFGVSGVAFMSLFWTSPYAGPAVVILLASGGACYIAGAIVYGLRRPDPWPRVFGFHEIFHTGTVAGYACHMVAIYMVIVSLWH